MHFVLSISVGSDTSDFRYTAEHGIGCMQIQFTTHAYRVTGGRGVKVNEV